MKALIIGASGFVGSALGCRLKEIGWDVHGLSRGSDIPGGVTLHAGTLADPNSIAAAADGCNVVFHCAGETSEHASREALSWIHVAGTENVVAGIKHARVPRLVMLSCADATLLNSDRLNWKEDRFLGGLPLGRLARSRLLAEELALNSNSQSTTILVVRPALVWGPGDHTTLPRLCMEGLAGGIRLFGGGDNLLAITYIDNLVDALLCAAQAESEGGTAYHVSDTEFVTANEFFGALSTRLGLAAPRRGIYALSYAAAWLREARGVNGPWRADVAQRGRGSLLDCARAHQELDYRAGVGFDEGMDALAQWVRDQGGPEAICKLARKPAGAAEVRHHEELADAAK